MFKSYRKWGEPTIIEGRVMEPKCFLVEDMEEFENLSGELFCGIGSIAVVPSTGKIYYVSYEGDWKLWGGESDSGSDDEVINIDSHISGDFVTLEKTWHEINDLFYGGTKLTVGQDVVSDVYTSKDTYERTTYIVQTGSIAYITLEEDGYPEAIKDGGFV